MQDGAKRMVGKSDGRTGRKSRMDPVEVRNLLKDGYSVDDIQNHYGYKTRTTVMKFLAKNSINLKVYADNRVKQPTEKDNGTIQALYTSGKFSLRETALELGTNKKLLYEYIQKHPKLIPIKERRGGQD